MKVKKKISFSEQKSNYEKGFRTNLMRLAEHYHFGVRELGRNLGVAASHLTRLTHGLRTNPGLDLLIKLAYLFNVSIAQLIGEQEIDFKKLPKKID